MGPTVTVTAFYTEVMLPPDLQYMYAERNHRRQGGEVTYRLDELDQVPHVLDSRLRQKVDGRGYELGIYRSEESSIVCVASESGSLAALDLDIPLLSQRMQAFHSDEMRKSAWGYRIGRGTFVNLTIQIAPTMPIVDLPPWNFNTTIEKKHEHIVFNKYGYRNELVLSLISQH